MDPWLLIKEQSPVKGSSPQSPPRAKRSMTEESGAMDTTSKSKDDVIIDLLGDMKMAVNALTTRVQKVEEKSASSSAAPSGPPGPAAEAR